MPEINLPTKAGQDEIKTLAGNINTNVDIVNTNVDSVKTIVTDVQGDTSRIEADTQDIQGKVNTINSNVNTLLSGRSVKNVQRGSGIIPEFGASLSVTISSVNIAKSILIFSWNVPVDVAPSGVLYPVGKIASSNSILFTRHGQGSLWTQIEWQVIEFY